MNTDKIYAEKIASEYGHKEERKVVALNKLDKKVKLPGNIFAYTFGIIMSLIFGAGMCLAMRVIGNDTFYTILIGIAIGVIGMIGMGVNYPIYKAILNNQKKKYAADIMKLADEIVKENQEN